MYTWTHFYIFMRRLKTQNHKYWSWWQKNHSRNRDLFNKKHIKLETSIYQLWEFFFTWWSLKGSIINANQLFSIWVCTPRSIQYDLIHPCKHHFEIAFTSWTNIHSFWVVRIIVFDDEIEVLCQREEPIIWVLLYSWYMMAPCLGDDHTFYSVHTCGPPHICPNNF